MESSPDKAIAGLVLDVVLNALRHQWNPHSHALLFLVARCVCSTPCGINGILTLELYNGPISTSSAQRLAASMESSHNPPARDGSGDQPVLNALRHQWNPHKSLDVEDTSTNGCSTPCGINGILTHKRALIRFTQVPVLNALRHQWNPHFQN